MNETGRGCHSRRPVPAQSRQQVYGKAGHQGKAYLIVACCRVASEFFDGFPQEVSHKATMELAFFLYMGAATAPRPAISTTSFCCRPDTSARASASEKATIMLPISLLTTSFCSRTGHQVHQVQASRRPPACSPPACQPPDSATKQTRLVGGCGQGQPGHFRHLRLHEALRCPGL